MAIMYSGDEECGDDITSGVDIDREPDDFEELNRNEADDYRDEDWSGWRAKERSENASK